MSVLLIVGLKNAILVIPLALLALAAGRWSRRPALTHLLWTLVLIKMVTPPLIHVPVGWQVDVESWVRNDQSAQKLKPTPAPSTPALPAAHNRTVSAAAKKQLSTHTVTRPASSAMAGPDASSVGKSTLSTILAALGWNRIWQNKFEILASIWLAGSLFVLCTLVRRSIQFHRFLNLVEKRDDSLGPRAAELAARARIGIAPRVVVVDSVVSPMLWGMGRRACLVFPSKLVARLSPPELDALLLHELAHFARGDHWVRVLELASSVLYWWHPVIWWARYELEIAEEQCCDAWVVEHQSGGRLSYAEALLATIDFLHEPATARPPIACGLGEVPFLRTRLTQIMRGQVAARLPSTVTCLVLVAGSLCAPLEPALWASGSNSSSRMSSQWKNMLGSAKLAPTPPVNPTPTPSAPSATESQQSPKGSPSKPAVDLPSVDSTTRPSRRLGSPMPLAPISHFASAHSPDGKYRLDARVGQRTTLVIPKTSPLDLTHYQITCVAFAPDSKKFATGHDDKLVRLWNSDGGVSQPFKGCDSAVTSVQISQDGRMLAAGTQSGRVIVWDIESGDVLQSLNDLGSAVSCVRWAPQGRELAISYGAWTNQEEMRLVVWSPLEDRVTLSQSLEQPVGALEWLRDDGLVMLAGWDGNSRIMNVATGIVVSETQIDKDRVSAAAWSPDCPLVDQGPDNRSAMKTRD